MAKRKIAKGASNDQSYTAFDAKNRLGELLDKVSRGQEVTITRHGIEIARVVPIERGKTLQAEATLKLVKALRDEVRLAGKAVSVNEIFKFRNEGRR